MDNQIWDVHIIENYLAIKGIKYLYMLPYVSGFPGGSNGKVSACNVGDLGSIPGLGRSSGEGNGNPHQYSCLENPMDRVHGRLQSMGSQRRT